MVKPIVAGMGPIDGYNRPTVVGFGPDPKATSMIRQYLPWVAKIDVDQYIAVCIDLAVAAWSKFT